MADVCETPRGMLPVLNAPDPLFMVLVSRVADHAMASGESVTLLGSAFGDVVCCRQRCRYRHPGSVVLIPDVVLIELVSNGFSDQPTLTLRNQDQRCVYLYRVSP